MKQIDYAKYSKIPENSVAFILQMGELHSKEASQGSQGHTEY